MFIDLNDNGSANEVGEQIFAYDTAVAANDPANWMDIELIHDAQGNMVIVGTRSSTPDTITFVPLYDNGTYDGSGIAYISGGTDWDLGAVQQMEIKIDAAVVPEPGTLLLVGTGVLGVLGYIRRRRMS